MAFAQTLLQFRRDERAPLAWAFGYFFSLLCCYYILRPVRDEMGIQAGVENLQWLFTGTFLAMLVVVPVYGWLAARVSRRRLVPLVYGFFIANVGIFYLLFAGGIGPASAAGFFIWLSTFNLLVVSVFWTLMADLFSKEQAGRLFGVIAVGGSLGALVGPALTAWLAPRIGVAQLLPVSAGFLLAALVCITALLRWRAGSGELAPGPLGGSALAGFRQLLGSPFLRGIGLFIFFYTLLATFLYFQQAHIVSASFPDSGERTAFFATLDLVVNAATVLIQLFLTGWLVGRLGMALSLMLVPLLLAAGLVVLSVAPVLAVIAAVQVFRRAGNYALLRPAREMLFTTVEREARYKAKNVIDTLVYRGSDALGGWTYAGLAALGLGLAGIAAVAVPVALAWAACGFWLGRRFERPEEVRP